MGHIFPQKPIRVAGRRRRVIERWASRFFYGSIATIIVSFAAGMMTVVDDMTAMVGMGIGCLLLIGVFAGAIVADKINFWVLHQKSRSYHR